MWVEFTQKGKYKYIERYQDYYTGKTRRATVTLDKNTPQARKIAAELLKQKIEKLQAGTPVHEYSLGEIIALYKKDQKKTVKLSTYQRNCFSLDSVMEMLGADTLSSRLNAKYIRDRFLESGKSATTLNGYLQRFRAMVRWAFNADLIEDISFLEKLKSFPEPVSRKERIKDKYLEGSEASALIAHMKIKDWRLLTEFLVLSGLRIGEAIALENTDIYDGQIHVNKTYDPVNEIVTSVKTSGSIREVFIQPELADCISRIRVIMGKRKLLKGIKTNLFLFNVKGQHLKYYNYNKYFAENTEAFIGRRLTPHSLRHTHASLLMEAGVQIDTISRRLGHENSNITKEVYLHVTKQLKQKDDNVLAAVSFF